VRVWVTKKNKKALSIHPVYLFNLQYAYLINFISNVNNNIWYAQAVTCLYQIDGFMH
jgi:hypothetical protein